MHEFISDMCVIDFIIIIKKTLTSSQNFVDELSTVVFLLCSLKKNGILYSLTRC